MATPNVIPTAERFNTAIRHPLFADFVALEFAASKDLPAAMFAAAETLADDDGSELLLDDAAWEDLMLSRLQQAR